MDALPENRAPHNFGASKGQEGSSQDIRPIQSIKILHPPEKDPIEYDVQDGKRGLQGFSVSVYGPRNLGENSEII